MRKNSAAAKSKIVEENMLVYESLRNEMLRIQDNTVNCALSMYVAFAALFAFGLNHRWLFLATFVVLITSQELINRNRWYMTKVSVYIQVFFEEVRDDIHWESFHSFSEYSKLEGKSGRLSRIFYNHSSLFLSIIAFAAFLVNLALEYCKTKVLITEVPTLVLMIVLFLLTLCSNFRYRHRYRNELIECTRNYFKMVSDEETK